VVDAHCSSLTRYLLVLFMTSMQSSTLLELAQQPLHSQLELLSFRDSQYYHYYSVSQHVFCRFSSLFAPSLLSIVVRGFLLCLSFVPSSSRHSSLLHSVTGPFLSMLLTISSSCRSHLPRLAIRTFLVSPFVALFSRSCLLSFPLSFLNCAFLVLSLALSSFTTRAFLTLIVRVFLIALQTASSKDLNCNLARGRGPLEIVLREPEKRRENSNAEQSVNERASKRLCAGQAAAALSSIAVHLNSFRSKANSHNTFPSNKPLPLLEKMPIIPNPT
jgi:hypothetical protein